MRLTFIGKDPDSNPTGSPTVYRRVASTDPADLRLCRSAFEAVWELSIPHSEYQPV